MKVTDNKRRNIITGILCFCTTLFFNLSFVQPELAEDVGLIYDIIENLRLSMKNDFFMMTIMFAALYYVNLKLNEKRKISIPAIYVLNAILAVLWLIAEGFRIDDTTTMLFCSPGQVVKSIFYVIGATHFLNCMSNLLYILLVSNNMHTNNIYIYNKGILYKFYKEHTYGAFFFLMMIIWLPNTILSHPASIECDVWDSLLQYFGRAPFTAHHPPFFTLLAGWAASLGLFLGDINTGFFIYVVIQTILSAAIMAYALYTMKLLKAPKWLMTVTLLIAALSPYYMCYVTTIVKDTPYSFAVLLYIIELLYMHLDWRKYWTSKRHITLYLISSVIMMLVRHNGKYIFAVMSAYLMIRCLRKKSEVTGRYIAKGIILIMLPFFLTTGISKAVNSYYDVTVQEGESMREALSIPFQQTARYAKYFDDETSEEDKATIDRVIDYYALANVYEPGISDPVKARFHYYATKEDWVNYFKVWFKNFWKHPMTYFGATYNQNYYLIYPMKENIRLYYSTYVDYFYDHAFMDEMGAAQEMTFPRANDTRISGYKFLQMMPITGVFSDLAVYNILLMYLIIFAIHEKRKGFLWITLPVILSDFIVVAGPAIYDNIRYALPVMYPMPLVVAFYLYICREKDK